MPQGQVVFDNHVNNVVVAPVYGVDPANLGLARQGNTATGFPSGTQTYAGAPIDGSGFTAQLFGGPPHAANRNLQPLTPLVSFRAAGNAGFVAAPPSSVTVPSVPAGAPAKIQLRAWNNRGGAITNWAQAESDPTIPRGESWPFITPPLGGPFQAPPNLIGLESFNVATGVFSGFSLKINFQPNRAPLPVGYLADTGLPFAGRGNGLNFGWNFDHSAFAYDRDAAISADQRHDTLIEMQTNSVWEIGLSNGLYGVHVAVGDAVESNGVYRIEAEGTLVVQGAPSASRRWVEGDALVEVADGRLTVRGAAGAMDNRLCFVEIARIEPHRLDAPSRVAIAGGFPVRFAGEAGFGYQVDASTNLFDWSPLGLAQLVRGTGFQFLDSGATNAPLRYYRTRTVTDASPTR